MLESLFNKAAGLQAPTQVFSREICKIFKNNFFYRTPPVAASEECSQKKVLSQKWQYIFDYETVI